MPLTKTVNEVKEMLPNFVSNLSDVNSLPVFAQAEYKYLVPITGIALYNDIQTKYDANNLSADETILLKKMRLVAVAFAYHDGLATGIIKLGDNGAKKVNPNNTVAITKWEFEKTQLALITTANDAIEVLLQYLFEKSATYNLWTASDEYKSFTSLLIRTGTEFNKQYSLFQPMRTFFNIRNLVADAQDTYTKEGIGKDLLKHLLAVTDPDTELKECLNYLKKSLAYYSIKLCCEQMSVRFSLEGLTVLSQYGYTDSADHAGRQSAATLDIQNKINACEKNGADFLNKAKYALADYYNRDEAPLASEDFKTAFDKGPLKGYSNPDDTSIGNENYKGIYRFGG